MTLVIEYVTPYGITLASAVCVVTEAITRKDDNYTVIYMGKVYADEAAYVSESAPIGVFSGEFALSTTVAKNHYNIVKLCYADLKVKNPDGIDG